MTVLAPGGGAPAPPGRLAAVACDQITYTFGSHTAVDHVDLRIEPGETFGLLGPNGMLRDEFGMTVLMTTHYMDEADIYCERIALMHLGHIRATGTPAELKETLGDGVSLDDVFRHYTGGTLDDGEPEKGGIRSVRNTRRAARRLG